MGDWIKMRSILLLIAHQLGDFILQPRRLVEWKERAIWGIAIHSLIYAACVGMLLVLWSPTGWAFAAFGIVFASHALIDFTRIRIERHCIKRGLEAAKLAKRQFALFVTDQMIHLFILLAILPVVPAESTFMIPMLNRISVNLDIKALYILFGFITITSPVAVITKHLLMLYENKTEKCSDKSAASENVGKAIGILERLLIFPLCLLDKYEVIGFVLAAKSLARFKEFDKQNFAERYLIGTLASIGSTIILILIYHLLPC